MFSGQLTSCRDTTSDISRLMIHMRGRLTITTITPIIVIIITIIVITTTIIITIVIDIITIIYIKITIRTTRDV